MFDFLLLNFIAFLSGCIFITIMFAAHDITERFRQ